MLLLFKEKANKGWENKTSNSDGNYVVVLRFGHVYWTFWWLVITQSTFINVITGINDFLSLTAKLLKTLSLRYWWWFLVRRWYLKSLGRINPFSGTNDPDDPDPLTSLRFSSGTNRQNVFHLPPNRKFRKFWLNGKRPRFPFRFVPFRFVRFRFAPFRFANYSKPN